MPENLIQKPVYSFKFYANVIFLYIFANDKVQVKSLKEQDPYKY